MRFFKQRIRRLYLWECLVYAIAFSAGFVVLQISNLDSRLRWTILWLDLFIAFDLVARIHRRRLPDPPERVADSDDEEGPKT